MNLLLLSVLKQFADETRTFLCGADAEFEQWETYIARRTALFLELETIPCSADDLTDSALVALKEEIFQQEALIRERALTKLASVGAELRTLVERRRALHGYGASSSPVLFERNL